MTEDDLIIKMEAQFLAILIEGFGLSPEDAQAIVNSCRDGTLAQRRACIFQEAEKKLSELEYRKDFIRARIQEYLEKETQQEREAYIESLRLLLEELNSKVPDDDNDHGLRM